MTEAPPSRLRVGRETVGMDRRPLLMGIVNVTPDSFSDGGLFLDPARAVEHALQLVDQGADWLDIGGESTRPGSTPVPADEEIKRVLPVIEGLARQTKTPLSIDSYKAEVARTALDAGAAILNDVTGFRDPAMVEVAANSTATCIVMHMRRTPLDMMVDTDYADVIAELKTFFRERLATLADAGVELERTVIDPGIGFAKRRAQNLRILNNLDAFHEIGRPILLGASRKRIIGEVTGDRDGSRLAGTIATSILAYVKGVQILRVHDVGPVADAIRMARAIDEEGGAVTV